MPQLFDVQADFREAYSLAALNPAVVRRLRKPLEALRDDVAAEAAVRKGNSPHEKPCVKPL